MADFQSLPVNIGLGLNEEVVKILWIF